MKKNLALGASLILAVSDQVTKLAAAAYLSGLPEGKAVRIVRGFLYLKPTTNRGGLWGLFAAAPSWLFSAISVVVVGYLIWLMRRLDEREAGYLPPLALLLGGFAGNGIDRLRLGYVWDFVYLTGCPRWFLSTFNVADLAILAGGIWLVGLFACARLLGPRRAEARP